MAVVKSRSPEWKGDDYSMLSQCVGNAFRYRGMFESAVGAVSRLKANGKVDQNVLPGNVAAAAAILEIPRLNEILTVSPVIVAASHFGRPSVAANLNYDGNTPLFVYSPGGRRDFQITSAASEYGEAAKAYRAPFWPEGVPESELFSDAEYLLANGIDAFLHGLTGAGKEAAMYRAGAIYLFTERLPCSRCVSVLVQFLERYSFFRLSLGFMHPHEGRNPQTVRAALGERTQLFHFPPPVVPQGVDGYWSVTWELHAHEIV